MLLKLIFILLLNSMLFSQTVLKDTYQVSSSEIYLNHILPNTSKNILLYTIDAKRYTKRVKSVQLIQMLKKQGINDVSSSSRYIKFHIISPVDTTKLEVFLHHHYLDKYKSINITNISVQPRGYIKSLPEKYIIEIRGRSYLSRTGVINIKDENNKKIFFSYSIDASIKVLKTRQKIKRNEKISFLNAKYSTINFDKFKALPITKLQKDTYQTSRQIKDDMVLTLRDVETLSLVRKNSQVSVGLYNAGIYITFSAKALQNGKLGDIITIQKSDLKRLKAKVVGNRKVEIK